jgi:dihydrolipoamide dehydrogenase
MGRLPPASPVGSLKFSATFGNSYCEAEIMSEAETVTCGIAVLGAGPGGYSAAFRAADLGIDTVLIDRNPMLGGVCLNVGCIPSKALLHVAAITEAAQALSAHGVTFGKPDIDLDKLRVHKDAVVAKLTGGLAAIARLRKVRVIQGTGQFVDANTIDVSLNNGGTQSVRFEKAIIAAGSEPVHLPFLPEDPRIVDSTGALELRQVPRRMLVIGGGIIGLEMATVYSALGSRVDVAEALDVLMAGADRDLVRIWMKINAPRFDRVMLKTKAVTAEANENGIKIRFEGDAAPQEDVVYDMVLVAVGRRANSARIGADKAGVAVSDRGFIVVDRQMRTNIPHIFAIGDIVGPPMLAHKAAHEGHVAAEAAAGRASYFDARQIPSVAYVDPEIAWTGKTEGDLKADGIAFGKAVFPWSASGRAIANGRDEGFTKLLFDKETHRIIGGGIVGQNAGELIGEICLGVEMGAEAGDFAMTIHPHPTLSETVSVAGQIFEGVCTDLPPKKN